MINEIDKSVADIIKANLPQAVGEQLQKRLIDADRLEEGLRAAKDKITSLEGSVKHLEALKLSASDLAAQQQEINKRDRTLCDLENSQKLRDMQKDLDCERRVTKEYQTILLSLTRNIEFRESVCSNGVLPPKEYGGSYNSSDTKTKTAN